MEVTVSGSSRTAIAPMRVVHLLVAATFVLAWSGSRADEDADIVVGCHFSAGEFGSEAVDMCVKENQAARAEVGRYPESVRSIVDRCSLRWEPGWIMAKRCIDQDIAAAAVLEAYSRDHGPKVDRCQDQFSGFGETRVKICVEQAIAAESRSAGQRESAPRE